METPIRRLEGITYWVIENPRGIHDFINYEIRKEWETDAVFEGRDPQHDAWLQTLAQRNWVLKTMTLEKIRLNPLLMNYVDEQRGYIFSESLAIRSRELSEAIRTYAVVIWPLIVKREDKMLVDGYARYSALKAMGIRESYVYYGTL